jgi:hypothetical protein
VRDRFGRKQAWPHTSGASLGGLRWGLLALSLHAAGKVERSPIERAVAYAEDLAGEISVVAVAPMLTRSLELGNAFHGPGR